MQINGEVYKSIIQHKTLKHSLLAHQILYVITYLLTDKNIVDIVDNITEKHLDCAVRQICEFSHRSGPTKVNNVNLGALKPQTNLGTS
jgi:hypothetical protein